MAEDIALATMSLITLYEVEASPIYNPLQGGGKHKGP